MGCSEGQTVSESLEGSDDDSELAWALDMYSINHISESSDNPREEGMVNGYLVSSMMVGNENRLNNSLVQQSQQWGDEVGEVLNDSFGHCGDIKGDRGSLQDSIIEDHHCQSLVMGDTSGDRVVEVAMENPANFGRSYGFFGKRDWWKAL